MEIINALKVQGRVISALTLHQARSQYGKSKLGFFWAFFEPTAHICIFILIFTAVSRSITIGDSVGLFILSGLTPWFMYHKTMGQVMSGYTGNKALLGYPQVMPIDIVISKIILNTCTLVVVMVLFLLIFQFFGSKIRIDNFIQMCMSCALLIILGIGVGLINAAIIPYFPSYKSIFNSLSRPLYFISGVFFTVDFLPPQAIEIILFNPILHLVELFRTGFYTSFDSNLYDPYYATKICISIFFIGLSVERISRIRARQVI